MNTSVKKITLAEHAPEAEGALLHSESVNLVADLSIQCSIRIGTVQVTIAELKQLKYGQTLLLEQKTSDPLEIMVNDKVIAKGALMSHEDKFAIQITELAS